MLRLTTKVTRLARQLGAQLVGGGADRLDRLGAALGEERGQLLGVQRRAAAGLLDRRPDEVAVDRERRLSAAAAATRDEAPVLQLHDVEHALRHPLLVDVLRVDAQPLGQRDAVLLQSLADLVRAREGVLGADVVAVGGEAAEVGRAGGDQLVPPVGEVRRDLDADVGHQPSRLLDEPLHVVDRDRVGPSRQRQVGAAVGDAGAPVVLRRLVGDRCRRPGRSSGRAGRSSGG